MHERLGRAARRWLAAWAIVSTCAATGAAQSPGHYLLDSVSTPGAIGTAQLQRGGPLRGYFQPVKITAPPGAVVSLAAGGYFADGQLETVTAGMLIGKVYRLRVSNVASHPDRDVYPTVELIDRLYSPPGLEANFAIPVELTAEDLRLAMNGAFVTRVIYLEDVANALPVRHTPDSQDWFDAGPGANALEVADALGRPVAILRIGSRVPVDDMVDADFLYGCPPWISFTRKQQVIYGTPTEAQPTEAEPTEAQPTMTGWAAPDGEAPRR